MEKKRKKLISAENISNNGYLKYKWNNLFLGKFSSFDLFLSQAF